MIPDPFMRPCPVQDPAFLVCLRKSQRIWYGIEIYSYSSANWTDPLLCEPFFPANKDI